MAGKHSRPVGDARYVWTAERLWTLAASLPVKMVPLTQIAELDQNCWFDTPPTCRQVTEHLSRINQADLTYPIILSSDGRLMDGGHRLCKALLLGQEHIASVRFTVDPPPDYVVTTDAAPRPENAILSLETESRLLR